MTDGADLLSRYPDPLADRPDRDSVMLGDVFPALLAQPDRSIEFGHVSPRILAMLQRRIGTWASLAEHTTRDLVALRPASKQSFEALLDALAAIDPTRLPPRDQDSPRHDGRTGSSGLTGKHPRRVRGSSAHLYPVGSLEHTRAIVNDVMTRRTDYVIGELFPSLAASNDLISRTPLDSRSRRALARLRCVTWGDVSRYRLGALIESDGIGEVTLTRLLHQAVEVAGLNDAGRLEPPDI